MNSPAITEKLLGSWVSIEGRADEPIVFEANGRVRMAMAGGAFWLHGVFRTAEPNVVLIDWCSSSDDAEKLIRTVNEQLARQAPLREGAVQHSEELAGDSPVAPSLEVRIVQQTEWFVEFSGEEMATWLPAKGKRGRFRRTAAAS